jgi:hypothetical protein
MQEADVPELVRAALAAHALDPCRLQLEITESAVLHDLARAKAMIRDVRELGVSVAIDDFGTGQSSLAYLQQLKFDELKIDRSFIQGVERHFDRIAIVELILNLAEKLGFTVTAEGIENEVTRDLLTSRRCQLGQGYHFARPMSVEAVAAVMSGRRPGMLLTAADLARAAIVDHADVADVIELRRGEAREPRAEQLREEPPGDGVWHGQARSSEGGEEVREGDRVGAGDVEDPAHVRGEGALDGLADVLLVHHHVVDRVALRQRVERVAGVVEGDP